MGYQHQADGSEGGADDPLLRANSAHPRQSRPDSGLGFQVKVITPFTFSPLCSLNGVFRKGARNRPEEDEDSEDGTEGGAAQPPPGARATRTGALLL